MRENKSPVYWLVVIAGCGLIGTCPGLCVNAAGLFFCPNAVGFCAGRESVSVALTIYSRRGVYGSESSRGIAQIWLQKDGNRRNDH